MRTFKFTTVAFAIVGVLSYLSPTQAQSQGPGWFVPPGGQSGAAQGRPPGGRPAPQSRPAPQLRAPTVQAPVPGARAPNDFEAGAPPPQVPLPPVPELPALPRGPAPPAAVIGVLGVPEIMRASSSAQQVERTIGERREKLNADAQKEQAVWRELQQALTNQRAGLSAEQIRVKERELQERITNAQRVFRDKNRIIQEAAQVGLGQIERTLIGVIRQVAESRGMNLVLHRAQVALNVNEFDITDQVAEQMNKILPSVTIPADGVSPLAAQQGNPASGVQKEQTASPQISPDGAQHTDVPAASDAPTSPHPVAAPAAPAAPAANGATPRNPSPTSPPAPRH